MPLLTEQVLTEGHSVPGTVLGTGMWRLLESDKPPGPAPAAYVGDPRQQCLNRGGHAISHIKRLEVGFQGAQCPSDPGVSLSALLAFAGGFHLRDYERKAPPPAYLAELLFFK